MAQNITLLGANYPDVPAVQLPITGGGTATFSDTRSVTYNLSGGATASVTPSEVVAGQGFSLKLKAPAGYELSNVSITMGGVDITSQVFTPDEQGGGGGGGGNLQTKSVSYTPTTSQQSAQVTADSGYDGLQQVNVSVGAIPSEYIIPTGTKSITANGTGIDVKAYEKVDVAVPTSGSSKNVQVVQGTTRTTSSTMTAIGAELTVSKTGTYNVYWTGVRTSTSGSYTFATQLYINGTAYGSENTTWSNHIQNVHLSNVSLTVNQKLRVYGRESRNSSYYMYAGTLIIVEA